MKNESTTAATATVEAGSAPTETKPKAKRKAPSGPRRSAVERLQEQLAAAQAKAAEKAETRIEKAKAEVTAAEKDYNRASGRLEAARTTLDELEKAIANG